MTATPTGPTSSDLASDAQPMTVDCSQHARWHAEQAAHLDTDQQAMFG